MFDPLSKTADAARDRFESLTDRDHGKGGNLGITRTEAVLGLVTAIGTSLLTRKLLEQSWQRALHRSPPKNPSSTAVSWQEAIAWGAISGAVIGVARLASRRAATGIYRST